jgi:hypothetical protein
MLPSSARCTDGGSTFLILLLSPYNKFRLLTQSRNRHSWPDVIQLENEMSETIEQRMQSIEDAFVEVKKLRGIPGPRGGAGPIDAAVVNATKAANQAVADAEARVQKKADEAFQKLLAESVKHKAEAAKLRREVADLKTYLNERIENAVDGNVVQTLHDYHLLKDGNPSSDYMAHEIRDIIKKNKSY